MTFPALQTLKIREVAVLLRVPCETVTKLIETGRLRAAYPAGPDKPRVPLCSLAALFERPPKKRAAR